MPDGVPPNLPYMVAAYVVAGIIVLGYAIALYRRGRPR
jgi:hypothetical protein